METTVDKIRAALAEQPDLSSAQLAEMMGVGPKTISLLVRRHGIQLSAPQAYDVTNIGDKCPECGSIGNSVKDSRPAQYQGLPSVRRRRKCGGCGIKFTTHEISEATLNKALNPDKLRAKMARVLIDALLAGDAK